MATGVLAAEANEDNASGPPRENVIAQIVVVAEAQVIKGRSVDGKSDEEDES